MGKGEYIMLKFSTDTQLTQATNVTSLALGYYEDTDYKTESVTVFTGSVVQDGSIGDYVVIDFQIAAPKADRASDRTYESITIKSGDTSIATSPKNLHLVQNANTILRCRLSAQFKGAGYCRFTNTHIDLPYATNTRTGVVRFYNENSDESDDSKAETVYSVKDIDTQLDNISGKLSDDLVPWDKTAEGSSDKGKTTVQQLSLVNDYSATKYTTTITETGGQLEVSSPITGDNAVSNHPVFDTNTTTIIGSNKLVTETYISGLYTDTVTEGDNKHFVTSGGVHKYISDLDLRNKYVTTDKTEQTINGTKTFAAGLVVNNKITGNAVGTQVYYTYDTSTDPMTAIGISATGKVVSDNYISSLYSSEVTEGDNKHFVTSGGVHKYISDLDLSNKYVTTGETEQTIAGTKTFDAGLVVNNKITGDAVYDTYDSTTLNNNTTDVITVGATSGYISAVKTEIENKHKEDVTNLQSQIEGINAGQNLADIVADRNSLASYDIANLKAKGDGEITIGDKVQILSDSLSDSEDGNDATVYESTVYELIKGTKPDGEPAQSIKSNTEGFYWHYIGKYGHDSYTKSESDNRYISKKSIDTEITADDTDSTVPSSKAVNTYVTNTINNLDLDNTFVTVNTDQEVSGKKTFNNANGLVVTTKITGDAVSSKPNITTTTTAVDESTNVTTTSVTGSDKIVNENYIAALYTDTVADGDSRLVSSGGISTKLGEYVTLATEQEITGKKTFSTNDVTLDKVSLEAKLSGNYSCGISKDTYSIYAGSTDVSNSGICWYGFPYSIYETVNNSTAGTKKQKDRSLERYVYTFCQPSGNLAYSNIYTASHDGYLKNDGTYKTQILYPENDKPLKTYLYQGFGYFYYCRSSDQCISFSNLAEESEGIPGAWYDFVTECNKEAGTNGLYSSDGTFDDKPYKPNYTGTRTDSSGTIVPIEQNAARIRLRKVESNYDFYTDKGKTNPIKYNGTHTFADIYADHITLLSGDIKFNYETDATTHATDTILSVTSTEVNSKKYTGGYILDDTDNPDTATNYYPFGTSTYFSINGNKTAFGDAAGLTKITSFDSNELYTPIIDDTTVATSKAVKDKLDKITSSSATQASSITNNQPDVGFIGLFMYVGTGTPSMGSNVIGDSLKPVGITLPITGQIAYTASDSLTLSGVWRLMNNAMGVNSDDRCLVLAQKISNT